VSFWRRGIAALRLFLKAERPVQRPGSRGGRYWITQEGEVRYGEQPQPEPAAPAPEAAAAPVQWRLKEVYDLRPIDWDTGKREPGRKGEGATCTRCGREHFKVYVVTDGTRERTVGSGCSKQAFGGWEPTAEELKSARARERERTEEKRAEQRRKYIGARLPAAMAILDKPVPEPIADTSEPELTKYRSPDGFAQVYVHRAHGRTFEDRREEYQQEWWNKQIEQLVGDEVKNPYGLRAELRRLAYPITLPAEIASLRLKELTLKRWAEHQHRTGAPPADLASFVAAVRQEHRDAIVAAHFDVRPEVMADHPDLKPPEKGSEGWRRGFRYSRLFLRTAGQLALFDPQQKPVQHPGIRGGKGFFNRWGRWEYGERPVEFVEKYPGAEAEPEPEEEEAEPVDPKLRFVGLYNLIESGDRLPETLTAFEEAQAEATADGTSEATLIEMAHDQRARTDKIPTLEKHIVEIDTRLRNPKTKAATRTKLTALRASIAARVERAVAMQSEPGFKAPKTAPGGQNIRLKGSPNLNEYDWILVNISGGKDSQAALDETVKQADAQGVPRSRIVAVHELMDEVDHPFAKDLSGRQAAHYGLRFEVVARGESLIEHVRKKGKWPGMGNTQYCTADHKRAQADKLITKLADEVRNKATKPRPRILNVLGLRAEEASQRKNQPGYCVLKRGVTNTVKRVDQWLPIQAWDEPAVWQRIKQTGVEYAQTYSWAPRFSCPFCIYGSEEEHIESARHYPKLAEKIANLEEEIGHTLVRGRKMRDVLAEAERRGFVKSLLALCCPLHRDMLLLLKGRGVDPELFLFSRPVQHPGIRGGQWYMTPEGQVRYGTPVMPAGPHQPPVPVSPRSALGEAVARGVNSFRVLGTTKNYYFGDDKPDYEVAIDAITPPGWTDAPPRPYPFDKPEQTRRYDPTIAYVDDSDPDMKGIMRLRPESGLLDGLDGIERPAGVIWRGMSAEEYAHARETGTIHSLGDYNLTGQEGLTYYSTDPTQAESYAHGFAPWQYKATPLRPAYVVAVRDPGGAVPVKGVAPEERGMPKPIPTSDIVAVYEGVPYCTESGKITLSPSRDPKVPYYEESNRGAPDTRVGWRALPLPLAKAKKRDDPNQLLLFGGKKKPVQHPGSRGGHGYFDPKGNWIYGDPPVPTPPTPPPAARESEHAYERWQEAAKRGEPLIAYHGSPDPFDTTTWDTTGSDYANVAGAYFTTNEAEARKYTKKEGKEVGPVYRVALTLKNPAGRVDLDAIWKPGLTGSEKRRLLQEQGFDSLIDDFMGEIVVFDPSQIAMADAPPATPPPEPVAAKPAEPQRPIETPAFKSWFGDWEKDPASASKVVTDEGEPEENYNASGAHPHHKPIVMYHGSQAQFTAFDPGHIGKWNLYGPGFYFTNDKEVVEGTFEERSEQLYFDTKEEAEAVPNRDHWVWQNDPGDYIGAGKWVASVKVRHLVSPGYQHKGDIKLTFDQRQKIADALGAKLRKRGPGYLTKSEEERVFKYLDDFVGDPSAREMPMSLGDLHGFIGGQPYNLPVFDSTREAGVDISGVIYPCYLNIRDPVDVEKQATPEFAERLVATLHKPGSGFVLAEEESGSDQVIAARLMADIRGSRALSNEAEPDKFTVEQLLDVLNDRVRVLPAKEYPPGQYRPPEDRVYLMEKQNWPALLKAAGFDGITHTGGLRVGGMGKHRVWIAFEPTQIKAVENAGTWDPGSPDIFKGRLLMLRAVDPGAQGTVCVPASTMNTHASLVFLRCSDDGFVRAKRVLGGRGIV